MVTNGLGGYACGTVAGANTRRCHGFLFASGEPATKRTLLVAKIDLCVEYLGERYELSADEFDGGTVTPRGYRHLESFAVPDGIPTWRYAFADALLEQRLFMAPGANTTYLSLELLRGSANLRAELRPFVCCREDGRETRGAGDLRLEAGESFCRVQTADAPHPCLISISAGSFALAGTWYWNFLHRAETDGAGPALEDLLLTGSFSAALKPQQRVFLAATSEAGPAAAGSEVLRQAHAKAQRLAGAPPSGAPEWVRQLAIAADQFVVRLGAGPDAPPCIIDGYPWFDPSVRDGMIALPGLATALSRFDFAAGLLRETARRIDRGAQSECESADAALWMFHALGDYLAANDDPALARELFPILLGVVHALVDGSHRCVRVDSADGLLRTDRSAAPLTWMDASRDGRAVTPRVGKPVEINALWLNALFCMARLAARCGETNARLFCQDLLRIASASFMRYWNTQRACLYDVIDVDGGTGCDASLRPNQLFAVSLPFCVLPDEHCRAVVDICARELLTSYGLRSLSPKDPAYIGASGAAPGERAAARHQGCAWSWLLGPFAWAHYRVYGDAQLAQSLLAPMEQHLEEACVGTVGEILDGDPPHAPRGRLAEARSVAEILRAWIRLEREMHKP